MATVADESFWDAHDAYRNRCNYLEVFMSTLDKISSAVNFSSVKSCLTIGPGEGLYEIGFIEKCAANISKLTAVEQDHRSAELLKVRLGKSLPDVERRVIETDFRSWKGPEDAIDLILMFHVLYYHYPSERKQFLRRAHDRWLATRGFAVVVSASHTKSPGNSCEIFERLGTPLVTWEDIEADLMEIGFVKRHAYEIQFTRDFSNPDEPYLRFFQSHVDQPVTLADVRNAIEELYPGGKSECCNTLAVFQKTC